MTDTTFNETLRKLGVHGTLKTGMCSWVLKLVMVRFGMGFKLPNNDVRISKLGLEKFNELFPKETIKINIHDVVTHKTSDSKNLGLTYKVLGYPYYGRSYVDHCIIAPFDIAKNKTFSSGYADNIDKLRHLTYEELTLGSTNVTPV